jgi:hypothetical protein
MKDTAKRTNGLHIVKIRSTNAIKGKTKSVSILAPAAHRHNSRQGKLDTQEREKTDQIVKYTYRNDKKLPQLTMLHSPDPIY